MAFPESLRDPLPKSETYPVGRETLDAALADAGVEHLDLVYFLRYGISDWRSSGSGSLLGVTFHARNRYSWNRERIEMRIHAVPSAEGGRLKTALSGALPRAAQWIRCAETSENVWRSSDHALTVRWIDGALQTEEH